MRNIKDSFWRNIGNAFRRNILYNVWWNVEGRIMENIWNNLNGSILFITYDIIHRNTSTTPISLKTKEYIAKQIKNQVK